MSKSAIYMCVRIRYLFLKSINKRRLPHCESIFSPESSTNRSGRRPRPSSAAIFLGNDHDGKHSTTGFAFEETLELSSHAGEVQEQDNRTSGTGDKHHRGETVNRKGVHRE
ncbi:unnamed protein product [Cuscuta europaea]|uniref:Uncharacterized protein n=1 Tax=Cuscuta europaea TaxID=41803 RepID=A0A9P0ZSI1_CUSEU|nr:unnamed protein product [Cuscuta europaea]